MSEEEMVELAVPYTLKFKVPKHLMEMMEERAKKSGMSINDAIIKFILKPFEEQAMALIYQMLMAVKSGTMSMDEALHTLFVKGMELGEEDAENLEEA